jgi:tetratricopeptide (TPR) repeat protein
MASKGFWERLREARAVQGLVVFLGASWFILQILDILIDNLGVPSWVMVGAIVLLSIGLVIQLSIVWVQALRLSRLELDPEPGDESISDSIAAEAYRDVAASFTWGRYALGGIFAFALLFGLAGVYVVFGGAEESVAAVSLEDGAAPGVAVLPFSVSGTGLEDIGEGMVNLVSTNLDGVAGLRAIDNRTVLARWDERVGDQKRADHETHLDVARATGARYALLGSAVTLGSTVRLQADIYDLETGEHLDHRQIEGTPDNVLAMVDQLSIEVLEAILGQQGESLPTLDVASLTTRSLSALKAFLAGEVAYRAADFEAARAAYDRALEDDSTFALAHYQLANAWGWTDGPGHAGAIEGRRRAVEFSDRLPARQRLLVQATDEVFRGELSAIDGLRNAVERYPDHAEAWYLLGDAYFHLGARSLASPKEMDEAFQRAASLDPRFAPFRIHLLDLAFALRDSAASWIRIREYGDLAPGSAFDRRNRLRFALTFGDSVTRRRAESDLGAIDDGELFAVAPFYLNACCWHTRDAVLTEVREREDEDFREQATVQLATGALAHGELARGLELLDDSAIEGPSRVCSLGFYQAIGYPIPSELLEPALPIGELDGETGYTPVCQAIYAGHQGRWDEVQRVVDHYEALADAPPVVRDPLDHSTHGPDPQKLVTSLKGFELWKRGSPEEALPLTKEAFNAGVASWWLGPIYEELGRDEDAARVYAAQWQMPIAFLNLGRVSERLGRLEDARVAYEYFLAAWENADPEMQEWVDQGVQGILRVTDRP